VNIGKDGEPKFMDLWSAYDPFLPEIRAVSYHPHPPRDEDVGTASLAQDGFVLTVTLFHFQTMNYGMDSTSERIFLWEISVEYQEGSTGPQPFAPTLRGML
jgi:hypothetical protein